MTFIMTCSCLYHIISYHDVDEIRTPMNGILGACQLLLEEALSGEAQGMYVLVCHIIGYHAMSSNVMSCHVIYS